MHQIDLFLPKVIDTIDELLNCLNDGRKKLFKMVEIIKYRNIYIVIISDNSSELFNILNLDGEIHINTSPCWKQLNLLQSEINNK